jgi:hypothetical protein
MATNAITPQDPAARASQGEIWGSTPGMIRKSNPAGTTKNTGVVNFRDVAANERE